MVPTIATRWPPCRGESGMGIKKLEVVARDGPIREANQDRRAKRVCPKGENRLKPIRVNRTIDTRIFSTTESPRGRQEAEDREGVSRGLTEPPSPTEPIPSLADRTPHQTGAEGHAGSRGWGAAGPNRGRTRPIIVARSPLLHDVRHRPIAAGHWCLLY